MNTKKKFSVIAFLMAASMTLLCTFVIWWLFGQYQEEKNLLHKELAKTFNEAKVQVMDSMLLSNFINPLLKNKKNFNIDIEGDESTNDKRIITKVIHTNNSVPKLDSILLIDKSGNKLGEKMITLNNQNDSAHQVILHGVKLFIKEVATESGIEKSMQSSYYYNMDTLLLKKMVQQMFQKNGYNFPLLWVHGSKDSIPSNSAAVYFESHLYPKPYGLHIAELNVYLAKKITPQFIFVLILLTLSGAAFSFSYRNLKNQYRLNALKNDFISNISHELKTPVSTVKVALEALQSKELMNDSEKTRDYLQMALLETERLDLLINKVLNTAMAEEGQELFSFEKYNVTSLIEESLSSQQFRFQKANAKVHFQKPESEIFALLDPIHFQGVLINLLDNSLKYAIQNPEIEISLLTKFNSIQIAVSDNGPGIPKEFENKIFDKFFRVPTQNRHNVKGYGLGLNYCQFVMQHHQGKISFANNKNAGCTFTLSLPLAQA